MKPTRVTDTFAVSPQISIDDVAAIAAAGFKTIVNNRPDGEAPDQAASAEIRAKATAAGLDFIDLPLAPGAFRSELIGGTKAAIAGSAGPIFAYCRSGTRSYTLWALATMTSPEDLEAKIADAATLGFDIGAARVMARLI